MHGRNVALIEAHLHSSDTAVTAPCIFPFHEVLGRPDDERPACPLPSIDQHVENQT